MSYKFPRNEFGLNLEELNELVSWVDSELYEAGYSSSHRTSNISSDNTFDLHFRHLNNQFSWINDNEPPEVVGLESHQNSYISLEEIDQTFDKLNKQFSWDDYYDDNTLLEVDDGELNEQFIWDNNNNDDHILSIDIFASALDSGFAACKVYKNDGGYDFCWNGTSTGDTGVPLDTFSESDNGSINGSYFGLDDEGARNDYSLSDGDFSLSDGDFSLPDGDYSLSDGDFNLPDGDYSLSDGDYSLSDGDFNLPEGDYSLSDGDFSLPDGEVFEDVDEIDAKLRRLTCVDVEPEHEEEEDLYMSCRKDAIKMESNATRHSNLAKICYLGGDHISCKRLSQKAQEEKKAAEKLHEEAARKILIIKNKNNGIMKLDLHCLRVKEAIQAVKERLHKIENQGGSKFLYEQLEVITGRGKHSPGKPKLPAAVRSFLKENGYQFDDSRLGVIMVQHKFYVGWV